MRAENPTPHPPHTPGTPSERRMLGLMAGTSLDGIDAALVTCTGRGMRTRVRVEGWATTPYSGALRGRLAAGCAGDSTPADLACLNVEVGEAFAAAARALMRAHRIRPRDLAAIASHGQTITHVRRDGPRGPATLQIGEGAIIAARTGVLTVCDFRVADLAAGGEGAPLIPYADYLLLHSRTRTRAVQNIGGIANVTYLPRRGGLDAVVAFDTGPGTIMIDAAVQLVTEGRRVFDAEGALAARGQVSRRLLTWLMGHPFLRRRPPKSADREEFRGAFFREALRRAERLDLVPADVVLTLTAYTAETIALAYRQFLPRRDPVTEVIVGGGGAQNPTLVRLLVARLPGVRVQPHEAVGLPTGAKEAVAFAVLGDATLQGLPANVPSATGGTPALLGKLCLPPPRRRGRRALRGRGGGVANEPPFREQRR